MNKQVLNFSFLAIAGIFFFTACGKESTKSCSGNAICYTISPDSLYLKLNLTPPENQNVTKVKLYKGSMNKGTLLDVFTTTKTEEYYFLPIVENYTVTAEYIKGIDTILVIDNVKMKRVSCEDGDLTCYDWDYVYSLDLKLKK